MILYLFKYCLPLLLGYTLFIGLAGRMNPFTKPEYPEERPSWFLGIWTGLTVALVLGVGMHMAYSLTLESAKELLPPAALFMGVCLLPGFAGYSLYRRRVSRDLRAAASGSAADHEEAELAKVRSLWDRNQDKDTAPGRHPQSTDADVMPATLADSAGAAIEEDSHAPIVASFLDSAELQVLDTHGHPAANSDADEAFEAYLGTDFDLGNETTIDEHLDDTVFEGFHYSDLDLDSSHLDATRLLDMSEIAGVQISESADQEDSELSLFDETEFAQSNELSTIDIDSSLPVMDMDDMQMSDDEFAAAHDDFLQTNEISDNESFAPVDSDHADELLSMTPLIQDMPTQPEDAGNEPLDHVSGSHATSVSNLELGQRLAQELAAHEETSRQLRITRKVLARLTPSAQDSAAAQATSTDDAEPESVIRLKEELAASLEMQASNLADANSEKEKRLQSEEACARMQQELIQAKHDIRRSSAARAKALSTANKAIAFARQTLQVRALLEEELQLARNTLSKRQDTISSVIRELENEKERTQEEVAYMAQQLVVHDRLPNGHESDNEPCSDEFDSTLAVKANGMHSETHRISPEQ